MQGCLWTLWTMQTLGEVFCILLGLLNSLTSVIVAWVIFLLFAKAGKGLAFKMVPFISQRSLGVIFEFTGGWLNAHTAHLLHKLNLLRTKGHNTDGSDGDMLHIATNLSLLPTTGGHVAESSSTSPCTCPLKYFQLKDFPNVDKGCQCLKPLPSCNESANLETLLRNCLRPTFPPKLLHYL
ncbi:hypothetical protein L7F22_029692 [Adiantum nelumboides]|nr:hypothetical protein [Adiantum nelumboides]